MLAALVSCGKGPADVPEGAKTYDTRGIIQGVDRGAGTLTIEHEDIPNFMPSMTMPFAIKDPAAFDRIRKGEGVTFRLVVTDSDSWIDQIEEVNPWEVRLPRGAATPAAGQTPAPPRLVEGDRMPDFRLIDQDGEEVTAGTFNGNPVLVTFIFTRCPMPNFCPLMSQNFKELQELIRAAPPSQAKVRLLSITIDPEFDSPEVLRNYGAAYRRDPKIWSFATGDPGEIGRLTDQFTVYVKPEGGSITHGLATVLVDSHGVIRRIWRGNSWKPKEIMEALAALESR